MQWTKRAEKSFDKIVGDIEEKWSEASAKKYVRKTAKLLGQIAENPEMCPAIEGKEEVRKGLVTTQTSVFYGIMDNYIRLITFWDNRRDQDKLKI
ncbi:MAG: type II toxin-antitoxin system RelE/ParE family toxin [Bacteroidales bacterium]|nr:type II toxin-antitoxin system RelE/ParE family toxin [Bacteroidales bacterium]